MILPQAMQVSSRSAEPLHVLLALTGGLLLLSFFGSLMLVCCYHKVKQGTVLLIRKPSGTKVSFRGGFVLPGLQRAEVADITMAAVAVDCVGRDALICKDRTRAAVEAVFFVRVKPEASAILAAVKKHGAREISTAATMERLFLTKFRNALEAVCRKHTFDALSADRDQFTADVLAAVGDLQEYQLERLAINTLRPAETESGIS